MPTNRKYRARKFAPELTEMQHALLFDEELPAPEKRVFLDDVQMWAWARDEDRSTWRGVPSSRELWAAHEEDVLRDWIAEDPGSRPSGWWRFSAPVEREDGDEQVDYLRRHRLLTPDELRRLR